MAAAKAPPMELSPDHERQLKALVRAHSTPQRLAERARIILLASELRFWFGDRILDVDEAVLLAWRRLVWDGQKANYTYAQPDALLAATAQVHGLGVVTHNTDDFQRAGVRLLDPWTDMP